MNIREEMRFMISELNYHTKLYDEGRPEWSDAEWDKHYFALANLENNTGIYLPDSPTQRISYEVVNQLEKVEHSHPMLSLAKTKDWDKFIQYFAAKDVIGMLKLDGLTCSLEYKDGKLIKAETRGNGIVGENILHNAKVIKSIPKYIQYKEDLIVDGEILITKENFEPFESEYSNQRNFASGSIRLLDSKECEKRNLSFIVWNVIDGFNDDNSFMSRLLKVERLGFDIVPFTSSFDFDAKEFLIERAEKFGYPIDGLVGRFDDIAYGISLGTTEHHSNAAFSYKFYDETYETVLKDIEWSMGRTGSLCPVAIFEPIEIEGAIIERASLHNLSVMMNTFHDKLGWIGQKIWVARMNMIIPQIIETEEWSEENGFQCDYIEVPEVCPICGELLNIEISDSGVKSLICKNSACQGKFLNCLDHFVGKKALDIKGLSIATLEKLIDWNWINDLKDIFSLKEHRTEWIQKAGFGERSVDNILTAIEERKNNCQFQNFLVGIGIPLIGTAQSKEIYKIAKSWTDFRNLVKDNFDWTTLPGFAEAKTNAIQHFNYEEADSVAEVITFIEAEEKNVECVSNNLEGLVVVITGKLLTYKNRGQFENDIVSHGGKIGSAVNKKTNYLISNENSTSTKMKTAQSLGVTIISEKDFIDKFFS